MKKILTIFLAFCLLLSAGSPGLIWAAENEAPPENSELLESDLPEVYEILAPEVALGEASGLEEVAVDLVVAEEEPLEELMETNPSSIETTLDATVEGLEEKSGKCGENLTWNLNMDTGLLTISGTGAMYDYYDYSYTPWTDFRSYIREVKISSGVTAIGNSAFSSCTVLESISIPAGVITIGESAFSSCKALDPLVLPKEVTSIGECAFDGCIYLESIVIPNGVTSLAAGIFNGCTYLKSVDLPDGITAIGYYAFYNCSLLEEITIPEEVKTIGNSAFYNCTSLKSVIIPQGVTTIGMYAFESCNSLEAAYFQGNAPTSFGSYVFSGVGSGFKIYYLSGKKGWSTPSWNYYSTAVYRPITGVSLNKTNLTLTQGKSETLTATITPTEAAIQELKWSSSNSKVAVVDNSGKVTALAAGQADITATTVDGGFQSVCKVTVGVPVTKVTLDKSSLALNIGDTSALVATITPTNATNKTVSWLSTNSQVASVDTNGKITALSKGETVISVTTTDGNFKAVCKVTVTIPSNHKLIVSSASVGLGKQTAVTVALENNPGLTGMKLKIGYDANNLKLVSAKYSDLGGGGAVDVNITKNPVALLWNTGTTEFKDNGVFATLVFEAQATAKEGAYPLTVTYDPEDIYNLAEENVALAITNGSITIINKIPGDINGDGKVNNRDATRLLQYLAGWQVEVVQVCLDVNGDTKVNNRDATRLLQYLAEWDVEIF